MAAPLWFGRASELPEGLLEDCDMETFRQYLFQEFLRRKARNPSYSLRAFALHLSIHHATLSTLLSGKRRLTPATILKLSRVLEPDPELLKKWLSASETETVELDPRSTKTSVSQPYVLLQEDVFSMLSEWYYDAILELSLIEGFTFHAKEVARALRIPKWRAAEAIATLERLQLLQRDEQGRLTLQHLNSTNLLDDEFTSMANRRHQRSVLEKSIEALDEIPRDDRDHTSVTLAIRKKDLHEVRKMISAFRRELSSFLQRPNNEPDEVYQLQISFFPLSHLSGKESKK